jgi:hypothetical protein
LLADCVERCLEKDPRKRFPHMREVVEMLEAVHLDANAVLDDTTLTAVGPAFRRPASRRRRRGGRDKKKTLLTAVAVLAAVALVVLAVFLGRTPEAPSADPPPATPPADPVPVEPAPAEPAPTELQENEDAASPVTEEPAAEPSASVPVTSPPPPPARPEPPPEPVEPPPPVESPPETATAETAPAETEPAPPPEPPPPPPVPRGQLLVNAFPWAAVTRIAGEDGTLYQPVMNSRFTPLNLKLPEGVYDVTLSHPVHGERRCQARVGIETAVSCRIPLATADEKAFFQQAELGAPGGDKGGRRPPPRPTGPGRPPPRREEMQPKWVRKAAQSYFDGDYSAVYTAMKSKKASDASTVFFARLFLGAAQHALYLLDGEKDDELRRSAVENLRKCREDFPSFMPHSDFFSPRFTEFYQVDATPGG